MRFEFSLTKLPMVFGGGGGDFLIAGSGALVELLVAVVEAAAAGPGREAGEEGRRDGSVHEVWSVSTFHQYSPSSP